MIYVDRIEEGMAVVYFGDVRRDIPLGQLPDGVHEGSVLREENGALIPDDRAAEERRRAIADKMRRLFK